MTSLLRGLDRTRLVVLALVSGLLLCLVALSSHRATAAPPGPRPGLGHRVPDGGFVGFYVTADGTKVYCISPRKRVPAGLRLHTVRPRTADGAALAYALSEWGDARTATSAAVESQVLNTLAGNLNAVRERARSLPARLGHVVAAHVAQARGLRGPYAVRLSAPHVTGPGQSAIGTVRVVSARGRSLPGVRITLGHSGNVRTAAAVHTDRRGVARFRYTVTDVGAVRLDATARRLPATTLRMSTPGAGEQRMITRSGPSTARASTGFERRADAMAHRYGCTSTCAGRPTLTVGGCAPAAAVAGRLVVRVGSRQVIVGFPASRARHCRSTTVVGHDRDRVSARWQFRTAHGWSRPVPAPGSFVVDCPAPPAVGVTLTAGCTRAGVTLGLAQPGAAGSWTPATDSAHRTVLVVAGSRTARVESRPGQEAMWTTSVRCGEHLTLSARAGVQRADGHWNFGPRAAVVTP